MLIGIDGNEANVEKRVGISEYAYELLRQFSEFRILHSTSSGQANLEFRIYLKDKPRDDLPEEKENWKYLVFGPRKLWTQVALPLRLFTKKPRPDVFFSPSHYGPRFAPMKSAIAIMDLSYIHFPSLFAKKDLYQLKNWTAYSVQNARKIFTISKASKDDIINYYKLPSEKVMVTYPGIKQIQNLEFKIQNMDALRKKYNISDNYILFVGTIQPRKNIARLIEAFAKVKSQKSKVKNLELVIVGKKGWLYEDIFAAPKRLSIEKDVKFLDFVTVDDLPAFYKNALCFVLPSLYEGFGLPVLEAMQYGCPVITSNVSSLPEAGGDACLYVNPENVDDIAKKIEQLILDKKLREKLIEKGLKHIKKFSWEKTAKETLKVLESLA